MKTQILKDVCSINMGQSPASSSYNDEQNGLPFFQGNADFGERYPQLRVWCDAPIKVANPDDILISVRAPIGALNIANTNCCIGRGLAALKVSSNTDRDFIYYLLTARKLFLQNKGTGSTFKAISKKVLEELPVPSLTLLEQKQISSKLNHLTKIIGLRRTQLAKLDELVKCRFVEMFGDPIQNKQIYKLHLFTEFAYIDAEMTTDYHKYANYPHIGIDSIEKETGRLIGYRTVAQDGVISGKYLFSPEHLIYSKIRPNLNKVACPDFHGVCSADSYPIRNKSNCNKYYLLYVLRSQWFLDYIVPLSSRTNLPKVNRKQIESFTWPLPPIELQNQFEAFVRRIDKLRFVIQQSLDEAQKLFDSLMQEYFD
ncbi:MAG: restriction endonuclease subunit S [Akkermansia sp.]|nr:restriction endonuclease subunit S [Akkermansia sp.]